MLQAHLITNILYQKQYIVIGEIILNANDHLQFVYV